MANRRRRRRSRRRGGGNVLQWFGVAVGTLVVVALGSFLYSRGFFEEIAASFDGVSTGVTSDRFTGAAGVVVPPSPRPDWWWTRVVVEQNSGPGGVVGIESDAKFDRILVPADVLFGGDSNRISTSAMASLREVAATVGDPRLRVVVVCHAARAGGNPAERKPLSERRADAVAAALEEMLGREPASILRVGRGDEEPLPGIDQSTESGRALNRRCEIFVEVP